MSILQSLTGRRHYDQRQAQLVLPGGKTMIIDSPLGRSLSQSRDSWSPTPHPSQRPSCGGLLKGFSDITAEDSCPAVVPQTPVPLCLILPEFEKPKGDNPQYATDPHADTTPKQVQLAASPLLDSTVTYFTAWFALRLVPAIVLLSNWIRLANVNARRWSISASHTLVAFSKLDLPTFRSGWWVGSATKCAQTRCTNFADFFLRHSYLGVILLISLAHSCWKFGDPSFEPFNYTHPPEDGYGQSEYGAQSGSGQWANTGGSRHPTEAGVWSHGSFNTGDPFASLVWGERQLERLRWLESEARELGCAVVPLPWLLSQTGSQPTYQFDMPPPPPFPISSQPWPSSFMIPERDNEYNHAGAASGSWPTDQKDSSVLNSLRRDLSAPGDSSSHSFDPHSTSRPDLAPGIPPDIYPDPLSLGLFGDFGPFLADQNTAQQCETRESNMGELGQLYSYTLDGLGGLSDTSGMVNSSFATQIGSTNLNTYAPGSLDYSNANTFYGVSASSFATMVNPATTALLQHDSGDLRYLYPPRSSWSQPTRPNAYRSNPAKFGCTLCIASLQPRTARGYIQTSSPCARILDFIHVLQLHACRFQSWWKRRRLTCCCGCMCFECELNWLERVCLARRSPYPLLHKFYSHWLP
ncbi:hypothetical protein BDV93DRAFT_517977 [Ceratobasidium sp. AG-I]|nr:hypothetical protein BDV93DRAFT_517977 [Ceratobasidium sp. AG-I]